MLKCTLFESLYKRQGGWIPYKKGVGEMTLESYSLWRKCVNCQREYFEGEEQNV